MLLAVSVKLVVVHSVYVYVYICIYVCVCVCIYKIIKIALLSQTLLSKFVAEFVWLKLCIFYLFLMGFWIGWYIAVNMLLKQTYFVILPTIFVLHFLSVFLVRELKDRKRIKWILVPHFIWWATWLNQTIFTDNFCNFSKSIHKISWNNSCNSVTTVQYARLPVHYTPIFILSLLYNLNRWQSLRQIINKNPGASVV